MAAACRWRGQLVLAVCACAVLRLAGAPTPHPGLGALRAVLRVGPRPAALVATASADSGMRGPGQRLGLRGGGDTEDGGPDGRKRRKRKRKKTKKDIFVAAQERPKVRCAVQ